VTPSPTLVDRDAAASGQLRDERDARDRRTRGLILAAGGGSRLGSSTDDLPKCLLEIGRHCLAEHQLSAMAEAGIGPTAMVVGYRADDVKDAIGLRAEYIQNSRWNRTNSLYSFWLAREWLGGPAVIMNSDVLFSPLVLERLLEVEGDAVVIDSSSGRSREQMKVEVVDGRLRDMSKALSPDRVSGENVGILKLSEESVEELFSEADELIRRGHENSWLGEAVRRLAARKPVAVVDVADLPWIEIDFPTDLVRARKEVWPRIRREEGKRKHRIVGLVLLGIIAVAALSFAAARSFHTPEAVVWSSIDLNGRLRHVELGEGQESWWLFDYEHPTRVSVRGPGPLRIDTRLLDPLPEESEYVIEVQVNGARQGWFLESSRPSRSRTHPDWIVGKRKRASLQLEEGLHEVEVRLVAPADAECLIRLLRSESIIDD